MVGGWFDYSYSKRNKPMLGKLREVNTKQINCSFLGSLLWILVPASVSDVKLRPWKSPSPAVLNLCTLLLAIKLTAGAGVI